MTKQEQIEEMTKKVDELYNVLYTTKADDIAEGLYNAGYRKTSTSDLASDTQKAFKERYRKGFGDGKEEFEVIMNRNAQLIKERDDLREKNEALRINCENARNITGQVLDKNDELQKQVDELLNRRIEPKIFHCHADALETCQKVQQAVKEFAEKLKEICVSKRRFIDIDDKEEYYFDGAVTINEIDELLKEYGVEVEE